MRPAGKPNRHGAGGVTVRGRPQGEIRIAMRDGLGDGPGVARALAQRAGVGLAAARITLSNMVRSGEARIVDRVRVPGVKRPVPLYDLTPQQALIPPGGDLDWAVLDCWAKSPSAGSAPAVAIG